MRLKTVVIAIALLPMLLQSASFEAATIKPASPDEAPYAGEDGRNGVLKVWNLTLKGCIVAAYGIAEDRIIGGPKWLDENRYDIFAKADYPATERELLTMLQPLLADRFHLQMHHETRTLPGYELTVDKEGVKAAVVTDPARTSGGNGGRGFIDGYASGFKPLAIRLSALLGRPVVDMTDTTNEKRRFDFHLKWNPDDTAASDMPTLFTALQEQLGLKLESKKVSLDVLVIDHVELPSEN